MSLFFDIDTILITTSIDYSGLDSQYTEMVCKFYHSII